MKVNPKPFQEKFLFSDKRYPAFVSGWGTGKTLFGILRGMICSEKVPDNLGVIVRKNFTDLRDSTMNDFERYTGLKVDTNKEVILPNKSKVMFRHGTELDVLKNINLGWFMMEQAEEFETEEQFEFLRGRLRRSNIPFHTGFIIANTNGHDWIWKRWKHSPPSAEYELSEATTFDNADNLPKSFIEDLKRMEEESPHHYARYVMNSWDDLEEQDNLIPYEYIVKGTNKGFVPLHNGGVVLACDIARFGDDETVFTAIQKCSETHWKQIFQETYKHRDLMQTAGRAKDLRASFNAEYLVVDDDGLGGGVSDRLIEQEVPVVRFNSAEKAIREGFWNKRIEQYWKLRDLLRQDLLELYPDDELHQQKSSLKYKFKSNGSKVLESKDEAKKRVIKSPVRADALMMACSVISLVPEPEKVMTSADRFWEMVRKDKEILQEKLNEGNEDVFRSL